MKLFLIALIALTSISAFAESNEISLPQACRIKCSDSLSNKNG